MRAPKRAACCAADVPSGESVGSHWAEVPGTGRPLPWQPLFSAHERRLVWSAGLQARLVKSFAAEDLSLSLEQVDARLAQLLVLLPELGAPAPRVPPQRSPWPATQAPPREQQQTAVPQTRLLRSASPRTRQAQWCGAARGRCDAQAVAWRR